MAIFYADTPRSRVVPALREFSMNIDLREAYDIIWSTHGYASSSFAALESGCLLSAMLLSSVVESSKPARLEVMKEGDCTMSNNDAANV